MDKEAKIRRVFGAGAAALSLISIAVIYLTNRYIPFMMDDLWYSTMLSSEEPITGLSDIITSQIWHYFNWGGRSLTHAILQMTLLAGENAADILNVAMTVLLCIVICVIAGVRRITAYFAAIAMIVGLNANWKMSMFWQAGAANYLYITSFILLYLYCYLRELDGAKKLPGITLWIIPLGVLAGWSNENMGPAVWIISLIVLFLIRKEGKKIRLWHVLGSLCCLFGSVMMIIAPGNFVRASEIAETYYGTLWRVFLHCYAESQAALNYLFPTLLLLAGVLIVSKCILKLPIDRKNILLLLCALLSWGAMILSPHYPDRATFGTMSLLICVIISLSADVINARKDLLAPSMGVCAMVWLRGMFFLGEFIAMCWGWIV